MFHFLFRSLGMIILASALIAAVLDITRSVAASSVVITPAAVSWASLSKASLEGVKATVESYAAWVWEPVLVTILQLPTWLLLCFLALILLWIGQKREDPFGRFASR